MRQPEDELAAMREAGLLRELRRVEPARPPLLRIGGRVVVNFSSNDYLGLAQDEEVREAARKATGQFGAGSTASRLISGSLGIHHDLERFERTFSRQRLYGFPVIRHDFPTSTP